MPREELFARIPAFGSLAPDDVAALVKRLAVGFTVWGSLIGVRRIGFDPATSSAPFVATLADVTGLVIYFSVASVILRGLVL
jgi:magnesium transporter